MKIESVFTSDQALRIKNNAYKFLQERKYVGGVPKEYALEAVNTGVRDSLKLADETIISLKKDFETQKTQLEEEAKQILAQKEELTMKAMFEIAQMKMKANAIKRYEKILSNGNTWVRKANKNGAVMEKEIKKDGKLVKAEVKCLDGSYRNTMYNPKTGKPLKTETYLEPNGKRIIEYDESGNFLKETPAD